MSFFNKLFGKKEEKQPKRRVSIKEEAKNDNPKTSEIADEDTPKDLERVDTYAGPLTKFLLKFIHIEHAYIEVEKAFLNCSKKKLLKLNKTKSIKSKMVLKQSSIDIPNMLNILQFPKMSNKEIESIVNKDIKIESKIIDINSKKDVTLRRFLICVGQLYFHLKTEKEKSTKNNNNNNDNDTNNDDDDDDIKKEDTNNKNQDIFNKIAKGYDVVKDMFEYIDKDGSGAIDKDEFSKTFGQSLRGAEKDKLIKERMNEMDYNKDGQISFNEFIIGIAQWIRWDEDDDDDDIEF